MVFICNPNNPTGILTDIDTISEIAKACRSINSVLLVESVFRFCIEFTKYSARVLLNEYHNVMVVKAFTKSIHARSAALGYDL